MSTVLTSVYIARSSGGSVLYVGITGAGFVRLKQHRRSGEWWPSVASFEVEHYDDADHARKREEALIAKHQPPYNVVHRKPKPVPRRTRVSHRDRVRDLIGAGLNVREVARACGLSTQAVYKHLKAIEADRDGRRDGEPAA